MKIYIPYKRKFIGFTSMLLFIALNNSLIQAQTHLFPNDLFITAVDNKASVNGSFAIKLQHSKSILPGTSFIITNADFNKDNAGITTWSQTNATIVARFTYNGQDTIPGDTRSCFFVPAEGDGPTIMIYGEDQTEDFTVERLSINFPQTDPTKDNGSDQFYVLQGDFYESNGYNNLLGSVVDGVLFQKNGYQLSEYDKPKELQNRDTGIDLPNDESYVGSLLCDGSIINIFHIDKGLKRVNWEVNPSDSLSNDLLQELCNEYCHEQCEACPGEASINYSCGGKDNFTLFLVDRSGSIDISELNMIIQSIESTLMELYNPNNFYAVSSFANTWYDLEIPTTNDVSQVAQLYNLIPNGGTDVANAFSRTMEFIDTGYIYLPTSTFNFVLLTDAYSQSPIHPHQYFEYDYLVYNAIKIAPYNAKVIVVRYQGDLDSQSNPVAAAIASKGSWYSGQVDDNPNDPEGPGPSRLFLPTTFSNTIPELASQLNNCDSLTVDYPETCLDPEIKWNLNFPDTVICKITDTLLLNDLGLDTFNLSSEDLLSYGVTVTCDKDTCVYTDGVILENGENQSHGLVVDRTRIIDGIAYLPHEVEELNAIKYNEPIIPLSFDFKLVPNPARDETSILFANLISEEIQIEILDAGGRVLFKNVITDPAAKEMIPLSLKNYSAGLYFIKVNINGISNSKKLVIVR